MESLFSRLQIKLIYTEDYKCIKNVYSDVFEYIEVFYNRIRRHSTNGYITPIAHKPNHHAQSPK